MAVKTGALKVGAELGRYECLQRLGQCAFGESWVLRFDSDGRSVLALGRVVRPDPLWDETFRQSVSEAVWDSMEILGDHVVHPADVVFENDTIVLACDYVEGQSLRSLLQLKVEAALSLPVAVVLRVVLDALAALDEAHEAGELLGSGYTFGGVAPECLFIGTNGETYVSDALLSGVLATADTARTTGMFYAAPEQATTLANARSDIFAMGCIAWELLSDRELPPEARSATMTPTPPTIPAVNAQRRAPGEITAPLVQAIGRATASSPKERFFSPKQMARAIEACGAKIAERDEVATFVELLASARLHSQRKVTENSTIADLSKLFGPPRTSDRPPAKEKQAATNEAALPKATVPKAVVDTSKKESPALSSSKPSASRAVPDDHVPSPTRNPLLARPSASPATKVETKPQAQTPAKGPAAPAFGKGVASGPLLRAKAQTLLGLNARDVRVPAVPPPAPPSAPSAPPAHAVVAPPVPTPPAADATVAPLVAKAALPPLPELPPAPKAPVSMLAIGLSEPPVADSALSGSDELDDDDLAELREFIGEQGSEPDSSPVNTEHADDDPTRTDIRYDDLMGRAARSVEVIGTQEASSELGMALAPPKSALDLGTQVWPSATVSAAPTQDVPLTPNAVDTSLDPVTSGTRFRTEDDPVVPAVPPRRLAKRYLFHPAVAFIGGSLLTLGAVLVGLRLADSGTDADAGAMERRAGAAMAEPRPEAREAEKQAPATPLEVTFDAPTASTPTSADAEPVAQAALSRGTAMPEDGESDRAQQEDEGDPATDDSAAPASVEEPAPTQKPAAAKRRRSNKPRSKKSKQFVPSEL